MSKYKNLSPQIVEGFLDKMFGRIATRAGQDVAKDMARKEVTRLLSQVNRLEKDLKYAMECNEVKDKYWDKIRVERNSFLLEKQNLEEKVKELETELYFCRRNKLIGEIVDG